MSEEDLAFHGDARRWTWEEVRLYKRSNRKPIRVVRKSFVNITMYEQQRQDMDSSWVRSEIVRAIMALFAAMTLLVTVQGVAVAAFLKQDILSPAPITAAPIYNLLTLPRTYDAELNPIRRIIIEQEKDDLKTEQSIEIIGTKLFNNSYMELYSSETVVFHVTADVSVEMSFPNEYDNVTPQMEALKGFEETHDGDTEYKASLMDDERRQLRPLRIGRFYMCLFCRGGGGCKGNLVKGKLKGSCTRLIAIGFDAEK